MKLIVKLAAIFLLGSTARAQMKDYDIFIKCQDSHESPTQVIELTVNPLAHSANLKYQDKEDKIFKIAIHGVQGIYSSSDVWIKSGSRGTFGGPRTLNISGQQAEIYQVTQVANFSLELETNKEGALMATSLYMAAGIQEKPDAMREKSMQFKNMSCVVSGINEA